MSVNFQDAAGVGLYASPIHDVAGNHNVQSSPSHNTNCGNTTNNITTNANNDSSVKIGGTTNHFNGAHPDLMDLPEYCQDPYAQLAGNYPAPQYYASLPAKKKRAALPGIPAERLIFPPEAEALFGLGFTRREEWGENEVRQPLRRVRTPELEQSFAHITEPDSNYVTTSSTPSSPVPPKFSINNPFRKALEPNLCHITSPHQQRLNMATTPRLSFDEVYRDT